MFSTRDEEKHKYRDHPVKQKCGLKSCRRIHSMLIFLNHDTDRAHERKTSVEQIAGDSIQTECWKVLQICKYKTK